MFSPQPQRLGRSGWATSGHSRVEFEKGGKVTISCIAAIQALLEALRTSVEPTMLQPALRNLCIGGALDVDLMR